MPEPLLKVENLKVSFKIKKQKTAAVEDVNFSLDEGKIIGIVGESGCGKSVTATSILRLMPPSLECRCPGRLRYAMTQRGMRKKQAKRERLENSFLSISKESPELPGEERLPVRRFEPLLRTVWRLTDLR